MTDEFDPVTGPDGAVHEFPKGTDPAVIQSAMDKHYGIVREPNLSGTAVEEFLIELRKNIPSGGVAVVNAIRDTLVGVATLPLDLYGAEETAEEFRGAIPRAPTKPGVPGVIEDVTSGVLQYGVPGGAAAKGAGTALTKASPMVRRFGQAFAAALADFAVTDPDSAASIGSILGVGPTAIGPEDTGLEKRAKIGAEAAGLAAAVEPAAALAMRVGRPIGQGVKTLISPSGKAEEMAARAMQESAINPERALGELESLPPQEGVKPTTGVASGDPGLIALEKGAAQSQESGAMFAQRKRENIAATTEQLQSVTKGEGSPEQAASYFEGVHQDALEAATRQADAADKALRTARVESDNAIAEFSRRAGVSEDASTVIDATLRSELDRLTKRKSELFGRIDPNRKVPVSYARVGAAVKRALRQDGPLDQTAKKLPSFMEDLKQAVEAAKPKTSGKSKPITFGDLNDLRPDISAAIKQARAAGEGGVVRRLNELKEALEEEAVHLAKEGTQAGLAADEAVTFFREEFAPKFRDGVGGQLARNIRSGANLPPTATARKFLRTKDGSREAAQDLVRIISDAPTAETARAAARDYLTSEIAHQLRNAKGATSVQMFDEMTGRYKEALNALPELRQELRAYRTKLVGASDKTTQLERQVDQARDAAKKTQKELQLSATRYFVGADPVVSIQRVFNSPNPSSAMMELVSKARQDKSGSAMQGLRSAVDAYLDIKLTSVKVPPGADTFAVRLNEVEKLFKTPKIQGAMRRLYSAPEMNTLKRVRDQLRMLDRINESVTAGSPTAMNQAAIANRARVLLASIYGIVRGRGVFMVSKWLGDILGRNPQPIAKKMLDDALLDPELGAALLRKDIGKAQQERLRTYITNNLLSVEGDEE